jgi:hypothetical protein
MRTAASHVLLDLAGHTGMGRLSALGRKPAPVIINAIGYPNTTGHTCVDYRIVDTITDPVGSEHLATDVRLVQPHHQDRRRNRTAVGRRDGARARVATAPQVRQDAQPHRTREPAGTTRARARRAREGCQAARIARLRRTWRRPHPATWQEESRRRRTQSISGTIAMPGSPARTVIQ